MAIFPSSSSMRNALTISSNWSPHFARCARSFVLIVLGSDTCHEYIQRVIGAGAKGYLPLNSKGVRDPHGH